MKQAINKNDAVIIIAYAPYLGTTTNSKFIMSLEANAVLEFNIELEIFTQVLSGGA